MLEGSAGYDLRYFLFLQNIGGLYHFTHSWSLCVEEHFYVFFPLVVFFLNKTEKLNAYLLLMIMMIGIGIVSRYFIWKDYRPDAIYLKDVSKGFDVYFKTIFYPTYTRLDGIVVGTALAFIKYFKEATWKKMTERSNLFLVTSIVLFLVVSLLSWKRVMFFASVFSFSGYSLAFGALLISVISENSFLTKFKVPGISTISILSYSLYLSHGFAIKILLGFFGKSELGWTWVLTFPLSLFFAYFLYLLIEKPFLRIRDRAL
jgi:peptidoglycan/LPS O-acetylase OafA/YrhL